MFWYFYMMSRSRVHHLYVVEYSSIYGIETCVYADVITTGDEISHHFWLLRSPAGKEIRYIDEGM